MKTDVIVVGAGIVGLAHAWSAAKRGLSVRVLERDARAQGATIRNFGMIWPVGQPESRRETALRSRALWLEAARRADLWVNECGSLHLAHRDDEWAVLEEFAATSADVELLAPQAVAARAPGANRDHLLGALWSPAELAVDPREAAAKLAAWLAQDLQVDVRFNAHVARVETGAVETVDGARYQAERILVCPGSDVDRLLPGTLAATETRNCKLLMLRTGAQGDGFNLGPHLAGGLTLRHYENFAVCPSLAALKQRVSAETPELDRWGIHVMAAQNQRGEIILGDSHEYGTDITPFDRAEIERLMLRELHRLIALPDWTIAERWHGIYSKHDSGGCRRSVTPGVDVILGTGGAGMTLSFGWAEEYFDV